MTSQPTRTVSCQGTNQRDDQRRHRRRSRPRSARGCVPTARVRTTTACPRRESRAARGTDRWQTAAMAPVVTLSASFGAGGSIIGPRVAEALGPAVPRPGHPDRGGRGPRGPDGRRDGARRAPDVGHGPALRQPGPGRGGARHRVRLRAHRGPCVARRPARAGVPRPDRAHPQADRRHRGRGDPRAGRGHRAARPARPRSTCASTARRGAHPAGRRLRADRRGPGPQAARRDRPGPRGLREALLQVRRPRRAATTTSCSTPPRSSSTPAST